MFIPHGRTDKTRLGGLTDKVSSSPRAGFGAPLLRLLSENPEITFEESMPQGESAGRSFRTRRGRPCRRHTALPKIGCVFIEVGGARGGGRAGGRAGGTRARTVAKRVPCVVRRRHSRWTRGAWSPRGGAGSGSGQRKCHRPKWHRKITGGCSRLPIKKGKGRSRLSLDSLMIHSEVHSCGNEARGEERGGRGPRRLTCGEGRGPRGQPWRYACMVDMDGPS